MWWLKEHLQTVTMLAAAACNFLPGALSGACGILIGAFYLLSVSKIDEGIRLKKCLSIRFPAPPLIDYSLFRWDLVTCRLSKTTHEQFEARIAVELVLRLMFLGCLGFLILEPERQAGVLPLVLGVGALACLLGRRVVSKAARNKSR